jgi:kynurenine formamidase
LLSRKIPIIEGLDLTGAAPGKYFLFAPPIKAVGLEAMFCRAVLVDGMFFNE